MCSTRWIRTCSVEEIYQARSNLRRNGIRACFFLQFGYPGEEWADIEATIRMVRETRPDDVGISVSYPLPGTKFHQIVSAQMGAKANWDDSADVSMIFRGAYSTEFYRALADALHIEVRGGAGARAAWLRVEELRDSKSARSRGMKRLLLTHGYFLGEDAKEQQIMKPYPPLGILYLSSHLRAQGFNVDVYDSTFGSREELFRILTMKARRRDRNLRQSDDACQRARDRRARACGGVAGDRWRSRAGELCRRVSCEGRGHHHRGEAERTLEQLAATDFDPEVLALHSRTYLPFRTEIGLVTRIVRTGPVELIGDLDGQPWPDREQLDIGRYLEVWRTHHGLVPFP